MKQILPIFDEMKKLWPDQTYLDVTGAKHLMRQFHERGQWPEKIRLPYNFITIGWDNVSGESHKNIAAICSEHDSGNTLMFLFFLYHRDAVQLEFEENYIVWSRCAPLDPFAGIVKWPDIIDVEPGSTEKLAEWKEAHTAEQLETIVKLVKDLTVKVLSVLAIINSVKNISIVDYQPPMSRQVRRQLARTGGMIKHKILEIDLGGKRGRVPLVSVAEEKGLPLHWVRGHFANYDIHPLFGKYAGTFWKMPHLRGDRKNGVVLKDYRLHGGADGDEARSN